MSVIVTANPEVIDDGETSQLNAVASGGDGNYTYHWEPVETLNSPNIANPVATPVEAETTYKVSVTDGLGNTVDGEVTVTIRDWTVNESGLKALKIYPNPNNGNFFIEAESEVIYQLYNSVGQCILTGICNGQVQVKAEVLQQGIYFLHLNGTNGSKVEKLVIEK